MKKSALRFVVILFAMAVLLVLVAGTAQSASNVTWSGVNTNWSQPDSDSWSGATYNSDDTAQFGDTGVGTVIIDAGGVTPGAVVVSSGTYTFSGGSIGGTGSLTKDGTGVLLLNSTTSSYSGGTVINSGRLNAASDAALGLSSGSITLNGGELGANNGTGTARQNGINIDSARDVIVTSAGGSIAVSGNNHFTTTGKLSGTGTLTASDLGGAGGRSLNFNATNNDFTGGIAIPSADGMTLSVNSLADSDNSIVFTKGGYTVATFVYGSGAISDLTLNNRAIEINSASAITPTIKNNNTTYGITIKTNLVATGAGAKTLTLNAAAGPLNTFAGAVGDGSDGGTVAITKSGAGAWILSGVNTYSGGTTVSAGTLQVGSGGTSGTLGTGWVTNNSTLVFNRSDAVVITNPISGTGTTTITNGIVLLNGSLAAGGAVTVSSGGTLGGTGTVSSTLTVLAGGTNAPGPAAGASIGVLDCAGNVTIPGTLSIDIDDTQTPTCDKLAAGGNLNLTGSTLNIVTNGSPTNLVYVIAFYGTLTGNFGTISGLPSNYVINYNYNELRQIVLTPIDLVNQPVTSCTPTSAVFNAELKVPGTSVDVYVYWGQTDGTNNPSVWTNSAYVGSWNSEASTNISFATNGLTVNTAYYYTFRATNTTHDVWASPSVSFMTIPVLSSSMMGWDGGTTNIVVNGDGASQGGSGIWNTTTNNWDQGAELGHTNWVNASNSTAIFGGTAGTVTLINSITVGGLQFYTDGYTVRSNILTFGTAGNIAAYKDATIASALSGTEAVAKTGGATLTLSGSNYMMGIFSVQTGTVVCTTNYWLGNSRSNQTVQVGGYGSEALWTNTVPFIIGSGAAGTNNAFNVGSNGVLQVNGAVTVGSNNAAFNSMTVTNASIWSSGLTIGADAKTNTVNVYTNSVWNMLGSGVTIGNYSSANALGNALTVNGGSITNAGTITVGNQAAVGGPASQNTLNVTNGARLLSSGSINVGYAAQNGANIMSSNTLAIVNSFVQANGALNFAYCPNQNSGQGLTADGNQVIVNGGTLQGLTGISFRGAGNGRGTSVKFNSLVVTNGGYVSSSGALVWDSGLSSDPDDVSNSVVVANGGVLSTVGGTIGQASSMYDYANIIGGSGGKTSTWNVGGGALSLDGTYTSLTIDGAGVEGGAVLTNVNGVTQAGSSSINLTNGGKIFSTGNILVGSSASYITNTLVSGVVNSFWDAGGGTLSIGDNASASYNQLVVGAGAVMTNLNTISLGNMRSGGSTFNGNSLVVTNGGKVFASGTMYVGNLPNVSGGNTGTANSNTVVITDGGIVNLGGGVILGWDVYIGPSTLIGNSVTINSGGQLFSVGNNIIGNAIAGASTMVGNNVTITGTNASTGAASLWNLGGGNLNVGNASVAGSTVSNNFLTVSAGGVLTNAGLITVGYRTAGYSGYNSLTLINASVFSTGLTIGNASSNNTVMVSSNSTWNLGGGNITNGIGAVTGNVLTVSASVLTNINALVVSPGTASSNSVVLSAGGQIYAGSATITNNNFLTVGIDDTVSPASGYLAASGVLNISNSILTIVTNGAPSNAVYVIASYGMLAGSFGATNGLPSGWIFSTNYQGNKIALIQPLPVAPAVVNAGTANQGAGVCTLQGMVTSSGVANAWICWGTSDAGTNSMASWSNSASIGQVLQNNTFSTVASPLATNVTYWYRCYASNSYGTAWASPATWFNATPAGGGFGGTNSGGIVTNYYLNGTNFYANIFTNAGSNAFIANFNGNVEVLVVGGGGGSGGNGGGGGGAGGLIYSNAFPVVAGSNYAVTVGLGGAGSVNSSVTGSSGSNSSFGSIISTGGGGGASRDNGGAPKAGGSSGGGANCVNGNSAGRTSPAASPAGQGFIGGNGPATDGGVNGSGGGGGGAGAAGAVGSANGNGGNGGVGVQYDLVGSNVYYAGGGGGGYTSTKANGANGLGGGTGGNRDANSGGGGGCIAPGTSGSGGSGIVIVRYVVGTPIVNLAPTAITNNSVVFNGQLNSPITNYSVYVHWGTTDGTNNFSAWSSSAYVGAWTNVNSTNVCYTNMSLTGSTTYYYTFRGTNASTNVWASPSWQFTTLPSGEDVNFTTLLIY